MIRVLDQPRMSGELEKAEGRRLEMQSSLMGLGPLLLYKPLNSRERGGLIPLLPFGRKTACAFGRRFTFCPLPSALCLLPSAFCLSLVKMIRWALPTHITANFLRVQRVPSKKDVGIQVASIARVGHRVELWLWSPATGLAPGKIQP